MWRDVCSGITSLIRIQFLFELLFDGDGDVLCRIRRSIAEIYSDIRRMRGEGALQCRGRRTPPTNYTLFLYLFYLRA